MEIKVGCCGFPVSKSEYFKTLSLVEIQQTFYKLLEDDLLRELRRKAPKTFEFTFKAFQGLTHSIKSPTWKRSGLSREELKRIENFVGDLKVNELTSEYWDRMLRYAKILRSEIIVLQLPSSFDDSKNNIEKILVFLENFKTRKIKIALELRGWSTESKLKIFEKFNVIDVVDINVSEPVLVRDTLYTRLHGKYEKGRIIYTHDYSRDELIKIKNKIMKFSVKMSYVLFNNSYMYRDALDFLRL